MSLSHKYVNLKDPYNQDIKEQVTTIFLKKRRQALHGITKPEHSVQNVFFKFSLLFFGVNFSNNISINQVRVNERKTNVIGLWNLLTINFSLAWSGNCSPCKIFSPISLTKTVCFPMQSFFAKKVLPYFADGRGDTMFYFHISSHF